MPIFQTDLVTRGRSASPPTAQPHRSMLASVPMRRQESEESIRTDLCEGPILESPQSKALEHLPDVVRQSTPAGYVSDRAELIQRLKMGDRPAWLPAIQNQNRTEQPELPGHLEEGHPTGFLRLLPAAEFQERHDTSLASGRETLIAGLSIERPLSALHSGDFTQESQRRTSGFHDNKSEDLFHTSHTSWLATSPPRPSLPPLYPPSHAIGTPSTAEPVSRRRAPSLSSSLSASLAYRAPTSPLVNSESHDEPDRDISSIDFTDLRSNPRRHTYQPSTSLHSASSFSTSSNSQRVVPQLRRDATFPANHTRRSIGSSIGPLPSETTYPPPFTRSRGPSFTSEHSPLQRTSMVGSYEESILRGRMSTTPSRPLEFVAQIGVLGIGDCKASLRCPAHVSLQFPAVFYSYATTPHDRPERSQDSPSPYVGQIDLENGLSHPQEAVDQKRKRHYVDDLRAHKEHELGTSMEPASMSERSARKTQKQKRRSTSPKAPPGGCYRLPEKGQVQIVIKNPNKTAVKLFLVPYDLKGMEAGTKTFIRQRSYSAGPIVDTASALKPTDNVLPEKPVLRYLVHLHICCPSRGRFYLYKDIRVVFANRVPDGKEKLQNEIQLPEPRYSAYKPQKDVGMTTTHVVNNGGSASERAFRRRSSGFPLTSAQQRYHGTVDSYHNNAQTYNDGLFISSQQNIIPVEPIPFSLNKKRSSPKQYETTDQILSPTSSKSSRPTTSTTSGISSSWDSTSTGVGNYNKLSRGDFGYGGAGFASSQNGQKSSTEGLLALKLRNMGVGTLESEAASEDIPDL